MTKRVSKRFATMLIAIGSLVGLPLVVYSVLEFSYARMNVRAWVTGLIVGLLLLLASYLVWILLIGVMQRAVRERNAHPIREGVGNVLGMFVWTTHWAYIVLRRLPEDYRKYAERYQLEVPQLSPERFQTWAFAAILTGSWALVVGFPGNVKLAATICDAINAISGPSPAKEGDLHDISAHFREDG